MKRLIKVAAATVNETLSNRMSDSVIKKATISEVSQRMSEIDDIFDSGERMTAAERAGLEIEFNKLRKRKRELKT